MTENLKKLSNSQIDRLGERLKTEVATEDLRLLDEFRRSFSKSYENVVDRVKEEISAELASVSKSVMFAYFLGYGSFSGRPAKSTSAIVEKLRRESVRLSQMQDIAGFRVVVDTIVSQEDCNFIEKNLSRGIKI